MLYSFDGHTPMIGKDVYVSPTAQVIGNVVIDDNCYIGHGTILRGDYGSITIGAGSAIEEGVIMHAPPGETSEVGDHVTVGHGAIIHGRRIGRYAVIGMGATLSLRTETGEWSIIGEGSVVPMKQVIPPRVVAVGNPAKIVRAVKNSDTDMWERAKRLYIDLAKKYLKKGIKEVDPVPRVTSTYAGVEHEGGYTGA
jgi:carbonic anhydrase/acetyltransferase-like protein (isoleucine patch superfamily)